MNDKKGEPTSCPPLEILRCMVTGDLSAADENKVTRHISECATCRASLDESVPREFAVKARNALKSTTSVPDLLSDIIQRAEEDIAEAVVARTTPVGGVTRGGCGGPGDSWADVQPWLQDTEDCSIGQIGPYRLTALLGRGGMGIVFLSEDTSLIRPVAVKVLSPSLVGDATARERFLREAKAVAAIHHPSIVGIYEVAQDVDLPYFAMEFVNGESLEKLLADRRTLSVKEVLRTGYNVATGLAAAHAAGLIHRDIKPANILIEAESGRARLMDFGLARSTTDTNLTASGALLGTPSYMAPETIAEQPQDERTDLFSLGAVLYHMLTGQLPFAANTVIGTIQAISNGRFEPIRNLLPDVPPSVEEIIEKLISREPDDRFQSAGDVAKALKHARRSPEAMTASGRIDAVTVHRVRKLTAMSIVITLAVVAVLMKSVFFPATPETTETRMRAVNADRVERHSENVADPAAQKELEASTTERKPNEITADQPTAVQPNPTAEANVRSEEMAVKPNSIPATTEAPAAMPAARIRCLNYAGQLMAEPSSLHDAVEVVPDQGVIQLTGVTPFLISEPIEFEDRDVTITGPGDQVAHIIADIEEELPLIYSSGSLTLSHLRLVDKRTSEDSPEDIHIVSAEEGLLLCTNCTFEQRDGAAVWLEQIEAAKFTDCTFFNSEGTAIQWSADESDGRLILDNCLIVSDTGIAAETTLPKTIEIKRCRALNGQFLLCECENEVAILSRVAVSESRFLATDSILQVASDAESPFDGQPEDFSWRGSANIYTEPLLLALKYDEEDDDDDSEMSSIRFTEWKSLPFTTEINSTALPFLTATQSTRDEVEDLIDAGNISRTTIEKLFEQLVRVATHE